MRGQVNQGTPPFWRERLGSNEEEVSRNAPLLLVLRTLFYGGLAQLARAPALQAGGQRFESVILHHPVLFDYALEEIFDILTQARL